MGFEIHQALILRSNAYWSPISCYQCNIELPYNSREIEVVLKKKRIAAIGCSGEWESPFLWPWRFKTGLVGGVWILTEEADQREAAGLLNRVEWSGDTMPLRWGSCNVFDIESVTTKSGIAGRNFALATIKYLNLEAKWEGEIYHWQQNLIFLMNNFFSWFFHLMFKLTLFVSPSTFILSLRFRSVMVSQSSSIDVAIVAVLSLSNPPAHLHMYIYTYTDREKIRQKEHNVVHFGLSETAIGHCSALFSFLSVNHPFNISYTIFAGLL